jgi:NAD(P)-dependent dehydrogenase (short-subunit alcohol dehydrogenase family)
MNTNLRGKTAFITGAAHGQGRATALALAKEGVNIAAFDIAKTLSYPGYGLGNEKELESLVSECESSGVKCLAFTG